MKARSFIARTVATRTIALILALAIAAPQLAEARFQPTSGSNAFSEEQEVQLGKEAAADVYRKMPVLPDSDPLSRYVQQLGNRLVAQAPGYRWPYNFHVVNQKEINAFALPGGPLFVNVGTIQAANNEAQLAGVMAHEMSHVIQRHATRAYTRQRPYAIGAGILGAILGGRGGALAGLAQLATQFTIGSYFLKNSRDAEREADLLGADLMYDSGYDPRQLAAFFETIQAQGGARTMQFFSDHPDPGNRQAYIADEARSLPPRSFVRDSAAFQDAKRRANGMNPLTAQQIAAGQGRTTSTGGATQVARADVMPSGSFNDFQHTAYTIQYPDNWQVFGSNTSSATIAPRAGISNNSVSYGVIIDGFQPASGASTLDDATNQLVQRLRQGNPDMRAVGNTQGIRVNGIAGRSVDLVTTSTIRDNQGRTQREHDWLITLPYSSNAILYLVFIAPEQDFDPLRSQAFEPMLRSLRLQPE
ncbi:MAG: M48 family metalloprotease [Candidatus Koribacter versatilis]|uniref:M48 family metalloprotease n=1 Tax=Candidatus Korobacter versatilis TaxID=658062 RepID=A0A932AAR1_9BACT|nr:M48 family metalloprotease [Candidatus Koribacter versatilis]